jgi:hypothetical protein
MKLRTLLTRALILAVLLLGLSSSIASADPGVPPPDGVAAPNALPEDPGIAPQQLPEDPGIN